MANIGLGGYKSMMDWSLKTSTVASVPAMFAGLSLTAPTASVFNEVGAGSGYTRQTVGFIAAATAGGSASATNSNACTFGTFSNSAVVNGMFLADHTTSTNGSDMMWYGTISPVRTPLPNDTMVLNIGALSITLS